MPAFRLSASSREMGARIIYFNEHLCPKSVSHFSGYALNQLGVQCHFNGTQCF